MPNQETDPQGETREKKYKLVIACEVCGEPLRLIRESKDTWHAECSDEQCRALHEGYWE